MEGILRKAEYFYFYAEFHKRNELRQKTIK